MHGQWTSLIGTRVSAWQTDPGEGAVRKCLNPVRDADWLFEYSVSLIPVGDIRIDYLRDPVDRGQLTDAAPLTELLLFYTLRRLRNYSVLDFL